MIFKKVYQIVHFNVYNVIYLFILIIFNVKKDYILIKIVKNLKSIRIDVKNVIKITSYLILIRFVFNFLKEYLVV
mgnify:CR=1 FL=1